MLLWCVGHSFQREGGCGLSYGDLSAEGVPQPQHRAGLPQTPPLLDAGQMLCQTLVCLQRMLCTKIVSLSVDPAHRRYCCALTRTSLLQTHCAAGKPLHGCATARAGLTLAGPARAPHPPRGAALTLLEVLRAVSGREHHAGHDDAGHGGHGGGQPARAAALAPNNLVPRVSGLAARH